uniref:Scavenger receptor class F member 2 n=1 Tax=Magallana gigas TaxID=29159 RepID=A0A8W8NY44_MAGGI
MLRIGDASNAVDGQKSNLSKNSGHCVHSADTETATLWVNLTSIHNIEKVTIYFMTDNKQYVSSFQNQSSFLGFSVDVSNTTDRLQGTLCYKDTNFTLDTIPAVFTAVCSVHGQYVIYYNERLSKKTYPENYYHFTNNNVCEIEVYGCPATGCYGSNNSLPCPYENCQQCHKQTGTCQVCKPGYKGQQCKLECETGKYGVNCSKSCGNCLKQRQCQNVDGFCSKG